ncbi:MAG: hypothetical protein Q8P13_01160 [bacterium]|nr:hypothetical protein [bacterium]
MKLRVIFLLIFITLFLTSKAFVLAQDFSNGQIAKNLPVEDKGVSSGDIVSKSDTGLVRASSAYDKNLFGVVVEDPSLSLNKTSSESFPIVSYGVSKVKLSDQNGSIKKGDFVTSSKTLGVGQKATDSGFVLGRALEDLNSKTGQVSVFINIQYKAADSPQNAVSKAISKAAEAFTSQLENPENFPVILRYLLAVILAGLSFGFGFLSFVRALRRGIDAISRNPLAKGSIQFVVFLNLVGVFVISAAGVGLALFIIFYK